MSQTHAECTESAKFRHRLSLGHKRELGVFEVNAEVEATAKQSDVEEEEEDKDDGRPESVDSDEASVVELGGVSSAFSSSAFEVIVVPHVDVHIL